VVGILVSHEGHYMGTEELTDTLVLPYVPYRTLLNLREGLRQGIPQRIDRSVMRSIGGTIQRQLIHALRYLQLTDDNGIPQEDFIKWVRAEGEERQKILRGILREAYHFIIGENTSGFDLATATPKQLTEKFQAFGIHGDTVRKAEAFFLNAASDADITVSAYIKPVRQRREGVRSSRPRNGRRFKRRNSSDESQSLLHSTLAN
jgi:glutathione S-transferase